MRRNRTIGWSVVGKFLTLVYSKTGVFFIFLIVIQSGRYSGSFELWCMLEVFNGVFCPIKFPRLQTHLHPHSYSVRKQRLWFWASQDWSHILTLVHIPLICIWTFLPTLAAMQHMHKYDAYDSFGFYCCNDCCAKQMFSIISLLRLQS